MTARTIGLSIRATALIWGICRLAGVTFGAETVASFAKQSLGLDLATVPFGTTARTNFEKADAPVSPPPLTSTNLCWTTSAASEKYRHDYPNRVLRYGLRDGRLAAIRISISAFEGIDASKAWGTDEKIFEQRRKELRRILDELIKVRSSPQPKHTDADFRVQYGAMCAPTPESLFLLEIEITPVAGVESKRADPSAPTRVTAIYDPEPHHLWNRLFTTFYQQLVHFADTPAPRWLGPDVLDPPFGRHPPFVLDDHSFKECNAVLDEFLKQQGAHLIGDPLKRALLQHDLWSAFDTLAGVGEPPFVGSASGRVHSHLTNSQERHRIMIERQLAQAIHSLALSPAEIEKLPDTYQLALASGAFSHRADPRQFAFLPDDLFLAGSAWVELLPGDAPLRHTRIAGGRSLFRAFVKVPADSRGTNILADYVRYSHDEDNNHAQKPVKKLPSFPVGTQFLLLREMICLDENWQMAPTHIAEAVQFRDSYRGIIRQHLFAREAELSRDLLFHGKQGGLRAVQANEEQVIFYESLGFLRVDDLGNGPNLAPFPGNCAGCHQPRVSGTFDFNPNVRIATPNRSAPMDSVVRWKVEHGKLDQLREFARSPYPDAR